MRHLKPGRREKKMCYLAVSALGNVFNMVYLLVALIWGSPPWFSSALGLNFGTSTRLV